MLLKNENVYLICPEKDNIKMSEKYSAVTSIKFTDAKFMIEKKIERNDVIKKLLEQHVAICIKEIQVRNIFILSANTKMVMLKNMNVIEHMQLNEYSMEREASILEIIKSIDEMSTEMSRELNTNRDDVKKNEWKYYQIVRGNDYP